MKTKIILAVIIGTWLAFQAAEIYTDARAFVNQVQQR